MPVLDITEQNFEDVIEQNQIIFIDFWASWCVPCQSFEKIYYEVASQNTDIMFGKIDVEAQQVIADTFSIRSIPHLLVFKKGIVIYSDSGSLPKKGLEELVDQARDADMSKLEDQIDANDK